MPIKIAVIGVMMNMNAESGAAIRIENRSEFSFARLLGKISPKISTSTVMTIVARPTLPLPNFSVKSTVAIEDEENVHHVVSNKYSSECLVKIIAYVHCLLCRLCFRRLQVFLSLILLHEEKRCLRCRTNSRQHKKHSDDNNFHKIKIIPFQVRNYKLCCPSYKNSTKGSQ